MFYRLPSYVRLFCMSVFCWRHTSTARTDVTTVASLTAAGTSVCRSRIDQHPTTASSIRSGRCFVVATLNFGKKNMYKCRNKKLDVNHVGSWVPGRGSTWGSCLLSPPPTPEFENDDVTCCFMAKYPNISA